jgi:hypothetical protein
VRHCSGIGQRSSRIASHHEVGPSSRLLFREPVGSGAVGEAWMAGFNQDDDAMTTSAVQRVFVDDYSSSGQTDWREGRRGFGGQFWAEDLLGQLRFDALVTRTLVIPDSHVFDGPYFLRQAPRELALALGRPAEDGAEPRLPFEVRGRGDGLAETLATFLRREDRDTLNGFVFKSLDDAMLRSLLATELGRTPSEELDAALACSEDVARAVATVVRAALHRVDAGANVDALVGPMEEGWRRWLAEAAYVPVRTWPIYSQFDVAAGLDPLTPEDLQTTLGRNALAEIRGVIAVGSQHRADISALLAAPRARASTAGDEAGLADLQLLDLWYSRGRYRALARQHGCACLLADSLALPPLNLAQRLLRRAISPTEKEMGRVELPDAIISRLATVDDQGFQQLTRRLWPTLKRWWEARESDDLKAVAAALAELDTSGQRRRIGVAQLVPTVVGPVVAFAVNRVMHDSALGVLAGAEAVAATSLPGALRPAPTQSERVQARILEALTERASGAD